MIRTLAPILAIASLTFTSALFVTSWSSPSAPPDSDAEGHDRGACDNADQGYAAQGHGGPPAGTLSVETCPSVALATGMPKSAEEDAQPVREEPKLRFDLSRLGKDDQGRFHHVNYHLKEHSLELIPEDATILEGDLDVFRQIIADNDRVVKAAQKPLNQYIGDVTRSKWAEVKQRIADGQTHGLPKKGPNNRMKRRHPYEAISSVLHNGERYVIRVHPNSDPRLAELGNAYDAADKSRVADFDTLIRGLFK